MSINRTEHLNHFYLFLCAQILTDKGGRLKRAPWARTRVNLGLLQIKRICAFVCVSMNVYVWMCLCHAQTRDAGKLICFCETSVSWDFLMSSSISPGVLIEVLYQIKFVFRCRILVCYFSYRQYIRGLKIDWILNNFISQVLVNKSKTGKNCLLFEAKWMEKSRVFF